MQFTWKKRIIIDVRNKYTTLHSKGEQTMTVDTTMGKITASKDALNRLSVALYEAADSIQARKGAEKRDVYGYDTASREIYLELVRAGYYHD